MVSIPYQDKGNGYVSFMNRYARNLNKYEIKICRKYFNQNPNEKLLSLKILFVFLEFQGKRTFAVSSTAVILFWSCKDLFSIEM